MNSAKKLEKNVLIHRVLLVGENIREISYYSDLIREVTDCSIDFVSRNDDFSQRRGGFDYHLIVIVENHHELQTEVCQGLILLEKLKSVAPAASIILISSTATIDQAVAAIRMGAEDYLSQPFKADAFQLAIKRGLDKKTAQLAYLDDATGLYNSRYLNYILEREILQARQTQKSFAVLFIDADDFKTVNDRYGHSVGTRVLNELGNDLQCLVREKDSVFRYGGDEFVAVLSPCDTQTAKTVAESVRSVIEKKEFLEDANLNIKFTISIGVALFPDHSSTKMEIIEAADQAMYAAKRAARNRISVTNISVVSKKIENGVPGGRR